MTKTQVTNVKAKEVILDNYAYFIEESDFLLENEENYGGKKLFYCNKNFIGAIQVEENERILKQLIKDLVSFAKIDNINIRFLFVSEAVKLFDFIESKFVLDNNKNEEMKADVKFYFAEESLENYCEKNISVKSNMKSENIEVLNNKAIASLIMVSDVVTLT